MNLPIYLLAVAALTVVSRSSDDHHARIRHPTHSLTERVIPIRIDCRRSHTHVEDTNAIDEVIIHHPIQSRQQVGSGTYPLRVKNTQIDKIRVWSDPRVGAI